MPSPLASQTFPKYVPPSFSIVISQRFPVVSSLIPSMHLAHPIPVPLPMDSGMGVDPSKQLRRDTSTGLSGMGTSQASLMRGTGGVLQKRVAPQQVRRHALFSRNFAVREICRCTESYPRVQDIYRCTCRVSSFSHGTNWSSWSSANGAFADVAGNAFGWCGFDKYRWTRAT